MGQDSADTTYNAYVLCPLTPKEYFSANLEGVKNPYMMLHVSLPKEVQDNT